MNERIDLLALQALDSKGGLDRHKFAELIVGECLLCCERVISDPVPLSQDTWLNGGLQCIEEIKHNFGIKK